MAEQRGLCDGGNQSLWRVCCFPVWVLFCGKYSNTTPFSFDNNLLLREKGKCERSGAETW